MGFQLISEPSIISISSTNSLGCKDIATKVSPQVSEMSKGQVLLAEVPHLPSDVPKLAAKDLKLIRNINDSPPGGDFSLMPLESQHGLYNPFLTRNINDSPPGGDFSLKPPESQRHGSVCFEILSSEIEVIQIIGTGGMGTVYKGRWLNLPVAIKSVFVQNPKDRILWEASLLSKLRHPCICSFFGMSSISGVGTAVILELLHRSLYHLVHKDTTTLYPAVLADGRVFRIAHEIASGLAFLHSHSLMHRDVKTSNVMLDELLHAKVCDFGIAKDFVPQMGSDDTRGSTSSSNTLSSASSVSSMLHTVGEGTPRYMAPEVLSGKGEYNESCDVYSLGLLLWEMTHRAIIFGKAHGLQVAFQHAQDGVRPEIELPPSCEPFRGLITAAWQHDPKTRPAMLCLAEELFQCTKLHQAENGTTYAIPDFSRIADCGHNSSSTTNSSDLAQHVAPASQPEGDDGGQAL